MTARISRRTLFGHLRGGGEQQRPPWSRPDEAFTDSCTLCGDCLTACPTGVLVKGHGGYPIVDFGKSHCSFCGACRDACRAACFIAGASGKDVPPWNLKAVIGASCMETAGVTCRVCEGACETSAIRFRPRLGGGSSPSISSKDCTGCGACVGACPVRAIEITDRVQVHPQQLEAVT